LLLLYFPEQVVSSQPNKPTRALCLMDDACSPELLDRTSTDDTCVDWEGVELFILGAGRWQNVVNLVQVSRRCGYAIGEQYYRSSIILGDGVHASLLLASLFISCLVSTPSFLKYVAYNLVVTVNL
jgi:hypothetical protein